MHLMKMTWVKIACIALLCLLIVGSLGRCVMGVPGAGFIPHAPAAPVAPAAPETVDGNGGQVDRWTFDPAEVDALALYWAAGSLTVQVGDGDAVVVEESRARAGRVPAATVYAADGTLVVDYGLAQGLSSCSFAGPAKSLTVTLPKDTAASLQSVYLAAASGRYDLADFVSDGLDMDVASGTVVVRNVDAGAAKLALASGKIQLGGVVRNALDFDVASGTLEATLSQAPQGVYGSLASGRIELSVPKGTGFRATVDKLSGNFDSTLPFTIEDGAYVSGDGSMAVDIDMASGKFSISESA